MGISRVTDLKFFVALLSALLVSGCSVFEPREPEQPSQSSSGYLPPTSAQVVVINLQNSIELKNVQNYINCFADPSRSERSFTFVPSADAAVLFPSVLSSWTYAQERDYMTNLISKAVPNGFSGLLLTLTGSSISADSEVYSYDYLLTFQHTEAGFPSTARGSLQFAIGVDNITQQWSIYRWIDLKTTTDITWSSFKGRFSN